MKKRILLLLLPFLTLSITGCGSSSGGDTPAPEPKPTPVVVTLESITASGGKLIYVEGEKFSTEGMVVKATYSDGSSKEVTGWTIDKQGALTTADTKVTVTYTEGQISKSCDIEIVVTEKPVAKKLSSLEVTGAKTSYYVGETFITTGMTVKAVYDDSSKQTITSYTYSPTGKLTLEDTKVVISYTENAITKTYDIAITVSQAPATQYTLSFESNGGSEVQSITVDEGTEISKPKDPTRNGYHFVCWCTDFTLKVEASWPLTLTENKTLYAKWNESIKMKELLKETVDALQNRPSEYLPETMLAGSEERLCNLSSLVTDYSTKRNVLDIQTAGYGEQWSMILENIEQSDQFFKVVKLGEAVITASVTAFNNYFDENPSSRNQSFDKEGYAASVKYENGVLNYAIQYKSGITIPLFGEVLPKISVGLVVADGTKTVLMELSTTNKMKYVVDGSRFSIALEYGVEAGNRTSIIEVNHDEEEETYEGSINEFITLKGKDAVKSSAIFYGDDEYLYATGNKADAIIAMNGTIVEVYDVATARLIGYKVKESRSFPLIGEVAYNTLWFNLDHIHGVNSVKAVKKDGTVTPNENEHNVYVNDSSSVFIPAYNKKATVKTSRKYDIEMRSHTYYGLNGDVLNKVTTEIPMMFIQDDNDKDSNFTDFPNDMNDVSGISNAYVTTSSEHLGIIREGYNTYIPMFEEVKNTVSSQDIVDWIG